MKSIKWLVVTALLCLCLCSCDMRIDVHEDENVDYSNIVLSPLGKSIDIFDEKASIWYTCSDMNGSESVVFSEGNICSVPKFKEPEIRYYKCEGDSYSKVYCVAYTGLPVVYINTEKGQDIIHKEYTGATIKTVGEDEEEVLDETQILVKGRGNSSWRSYPKKGFGIKFYDKTKLLGMKKGKKWGLTSNYTDGTKMGNWYASYLARKVLKYKEWTSENKFVDLILNGEYYGIFSLSELVKIDKKRVDIQDIAEISTSNEEIEDVNKDGKIDLWDGGFVIEVAFTRDSTVQFSTSHGVPMALKDPDLEEAEADYGFRETFYHIKGIMQKVEDAIYDTTSLAYLDLFDLESFIDWYIVNEAVGNEESAFQSSVYMYYNPSDGKIHMSTLWDFDRTLNHSDGVKCNREKSLWIKQLLSRPEVKQALSERWNECKDDFIKSVDKNLKKQSDKCAVAIELDRIRWEETSYTPIESTVDTVKARFNWFTTYITEL